MGPAFKNGRFFSRFSGKQEANVERETRATEGKEGAANVTRYVPEANAGWAPSSPDVRCSSSFELWLENKCGRTGCGCSGEWGRDGYGRWE